jgi:biopolymer transport protein ExbD
MAHVKKGKGEEHPKLDMTPMIDVVFQLLIFFVVTLKQDDIVSKLTAARPTGVPAVDKTLQLIDVSISASGFSCHGRAVTRDELDGLISRYASFSQTASIVVNCASDSPHGALVQALDIFNKHGMANVSIFSK